MIETPSRQFPPLLVFADDWGRHPSSCQHLIRCFLDRYDISWVNTIGMRAPGLDLTTMARGAEKIRQWVRPSSETDQHTANLHVLSPRMWPWFRSNLDRKINQRLLLRQLLPVLRSLPTPPLAVATIPVVADLIGELPVARWIYYCVDDFSQWPGLDHHSLARMEESLVLRADVLIAVSEILRQRLAAMGRDSHLLSHGVDLARWVSQEQVRTLSWLIGVPRPLIVFWGVIDRRMDVRFLEQLSRDLGEGNIVLVGPEQDPDPALEQIDRLIRLPSLPYEQLPDLAREASVLVMPYADLPVTRAMQPLKLKEYLATGRPTVVTDLPATRGWSDCLDLADTPESFSAAVRTRIQTGLPARQELARARLVDESWAVKAQAFEHWALGRPSLRIASPQASPISHYVRVD